MNILAIGAHPDDIEYGCGGALIKYSRLGHQVNLLIMTKGEVGARGSKTLRQNSRCGASNPRAQSGRDAERKQTGPRDRTVRRSKRVRNTRHSWTRILFSAASAR